MKKDDYNSQRTINDMENYTIEHEFDQSLEMHYSKVLLYFTDPITFTIAINTNLPL